MLDLLTPQRWKLLKLLRAGESMTVAELTAASNRPTLDVANDIRALAVAGLVVTLAQERFYTPWNIIEAQMKLAA